MAYPPTRRRLMSAAVCTVLLTGTATGCSQSRTAAPLEQVRFTQVKPAAPAAPPNVASAPGTGAHGSPPVLPMPKPSHFVSRVDNPYLPFRPGTKWTYIGTGADVGEKVAVTVLKRTKTILGVKATVVRDIVTKNGKLVEKTEDWYAQDRRGNVWYLGEATKSYENDTVSTEGSWQSGVDGAKPGIAMLAHPRAGRAYWQEFYRDHAEDQGKVLATNSQVAVNYGHFPKKVVMTADTSPLEPDVNELKFYARGVGLVLTLDVSPEQGSSELVRLIKP